MSRVGRQADSQRGGEVYQPSDLADQPSLGRASTTRDDCSSSRLRFISPDSIICVRAKTVSRSEWRSPGRDMAQSYDQDSTVTTTTKSNIFVANSFREYRASVRPQLRQFDGNHPAIGEFMNSKPFNPTAVAADPASGLASTRGPHDQKLILVSRHCSRTSHTLFKNQPHTVQEPATHCSRTSHTQVKNQPHTVQEPATHCSRTSHALFKNQPHTGQEPATHCSRTSHTQVKNQPHTVQEPATHCSRTSHTLFKNQPHTGQEPATRTAPIYTDRVLSSVFLKISE
ncbi:hypothetical protein RRG08_045232 [Elysia crispata]|uniref:Uncharacterized protein n=1 Tax=Elysia crispata TaxID=231223 RepID=A0AAE1A2V9_9GAST|nr:hypothetical protein RRG08_045232 [Elysia crispata]